MISFYPPRQVRNRPIALLTVKYGVMLFFQATPITAHQAPKSQPKVAVGSAILSHIKQIFKTYVK